MDLRVAGQFGKFSRGRRVRLRAGTGFTWLRSSTWGPRLERARAWAFHTQRKLATVGVFLVAGWLALHVVLGSNGWMVYQKKRVENRALQQEVEALQKENEALEQRVKALKSDPETIEKEAREQLRYAKPGEVIYVLPSPAPAEVKPPANATAEKR